MGEVMARLKTSREDIRTFKARPADLALLLDLVRDGVVSHTAGKLILGLMADTGAQPLDIAKREGLLQVGDDAQLAAWLDEVIAEMPAEAARLAAGEKRLVGVLVGAAMRKSGGRADPRKLNQLLSVRLGS